MHTTGPHSAHGLAQARPTVSCIHVVFHSIPHFINWCSLVSGQLRTGTSTFVAAFYQIDTELLFQVIY